VSELSAAPEKTHSAATQPWMTWSLCAVVLAIAIGIQIDGGDQAAIRWGWQPAIGALLMSAALVSVWAPWSPTWNAARALTAYHRGDYRSAAHWLDRSLRRGANAAWIAETKAMVHWQAGERNEARAEIDALRRIDAKRADRFERQLRGVEK